MLVVEERAARVKPDDPERAAPVRFEVVGSRAAFDALEPHWNALFERAGQPHQVFQTFNWLWHWAEHFLRGDRTLSIVTAWRGERLVMAWPLVMRRIAGFKRLSWMGEPVSQYGDVLVEDGADRDWLLRQGWARVATLGADVVSLRKVRADAAVAPSLAARGSTITERTSAPFLDFAGVKTYAAYEQRYSGKKRSTRRRLRRRLEDTCAVSFAQRREGLEAIACVKQALAWKKAWMRDQGVVSPALRNPALDGFFESVARGGSKPVAARICVVACEARPAAIEISFACKGTVFGHVLAYDATFTKQGIGVLLAEHSIRTAFEDGFARFDLLAPSDAYKTGWADAAVAAEDHAIPLSWVGRVYVGAWIGFARPGLKRLLARRSAVQRTIRAWTRLRL